MIIKTQPKDYGAAYSVLPLRIDTATDGDDLKYLINVCYNQSTYSSYAPVSFDGQTYTEITISGTHDYEVGDTLLYDNEDTYRGIYIVREVVNNMVFIIDLVLGVPIDNTNPSYFYKIVPYAMLPDPDGEAKLDLSNALKDFVSENFEDSVDIFEATNTRFDYLISLGEEYKYIFEFTDNLFVTGSTVAFINPALTSGDVDDSPFQVGDSVNIQQDQAEWVYTDNNFVGGDLAFISANDHDFEVGQTIQVTGQITHPSYNGAVSIIDVPDSKTIVVNKAFISGTPAEGGSIFGVPVPSYNTTGQVTNIYWDVTNGYVLETNVEWVKATQPIGGQVRFSDGRPSKFLVESQIEDLKIYNSGFTKLQYGFSGDFDAYVVQDRAANLNNISTILDDTKHRIERDSKFWLLVHSDALANDADIRLTGYDSTGAVVSEVRMNNVLGHEDYYFPCWINNLPDMADLDVINGNISQPVLDTIVEYKVEVYSNAVLYSNPIWFEINKDCSRFELYHLCWKDAFGSWLSYPFKYIEVNTTENERKNFYKKEGTFKDDNTFGFETYGRGEETYFSRSRDKMKLTSGWSNDSENVVIKDLMNSSQVFVQDPDGNMIACVIEDTTRIYPKQESDYLWNYEFNVRLSRNENRY